MMITTEDTQCGMHFINILDLKIFSLKENTRKSNKTYNLKKIEKFN